MRMSPDQADPMLRLYAILITGSVTRVVNTAGVATGAGTVGLLEHQSLPPHCSGVRVAQSFSV